MLQLPLGLVQQPPCPDGMLQKRPFMPFSGGDLLANHLPELVDFSRLGQGRLREIDRAAIHVERVLELLFDFGRLDRRSLPQTPKCMFDHLPD